MEQQPLQEVYPQLKEPTHRVLLIYRKRTVRATTVTHLSGTAVSAGAHAHTVGIGAHQHPVVIGAHAHSFSIGSHGHTITVNAAGNAENTVKNIAFNYIVRLA
ncbi:Prophage tail fiber domain protein [Escherichia coli]|uniref:Prophage tail fiber domain protein n=1 Tax=Escherichia coli TaxID=562 RepID=A0A376KXA7_ECOLX|nr:Prophage tail fiber domain protein [Escherichia coli]